MVKIYLDPGHGGNDPGAIGNGLYEKDVNLTIALKTRNILTDEYEGHDIRMSRTGDVTKSLDARTDEANAWGADYYLSIHINAGGGTGFESYIYNGSYPGKQETDRLRNIIHNTIMQHVDFQDRGKKEANFHVLRETVMPASLTENGFIDNPNDAEKLKSDTFLNRIARGHAEGLAQAFNLPKKEQLDGVFYRVIAGSFLVRENAEEQQNKLQQKGYDSFVDIFDQDGTRYFRVVAGSFTDRANAEIRETALKEDGFDSFITTYKN